MNFEVTDKAISISAKRNSGKSELVKYIIHQYHQEFMNIFVISGTEKVNHFYSKIQYVNPKYIYHKFDTSFIESLIKKMEKLNEGKTKKDKDFKRILLIMDDVFSSFNAHSEKAFEQIFTLGRHLGITIITITQYIYMLPPRCRSNCDWILVSQMNQQGLEILTNEYRYGNIDSKEFKQMYLKNTSDYGFLLINATCSESNDNLEGIYGCIRVPNEFIKNN